MHRAFVEYTAFVLPKESFEFNTRLIPYVYTSWYESEKTGTPIIPPMLLDSQDEPKPTTPMASISMATSCGWRRCSTAQRRGVELDAKGEILFFYTNGQFTSRELGSGYGRPAIFHIHIPASERAE